MVNVTSPELNQTLSMVRKLTREQRRQVVLLINKLNGPSQAASASPQFAEDWLLHGIEHELRKRGLLMVTLSPVRLKAWAPNFAEHSKTIRAGMEARMRRPVDTEYLMAFGRACAESLAEYLIKEKFQDADRTFGPLMMLRNVLDVPVAIQRSYPDYIARGTLGAIVAYRVPEEA